MLQELIWPSISSLSGSFNFYKLRELWWIDSYYKDDEYSMDALFSFLKLCPALEQLFVTVCLFPFLLGSNFGSCCSALVFKLSYIFVVVVVTNWHLQVDPESYLAGRSINSCLMQAIKCTELEHLKLIKFKGFTSRKDEISLAKSLVHLIKGKPPKINTSDGSCLDMQSLCSDFLYRWIIAIYDLLQVSKKGKL